MINPQLNTSKTKRKIFSKQKKETSFLNKLGDSLSKTFKKYDLWYESEKKNSSAIELSMLEEEPTKIALHDDDDVLSAKPKLSNQCIFYRKLNLKSSRNDNFQDFALIFRIPESLEDEEENITSNLDDSTNILNLSTKNIGSRNKHPELPIPLFPLTPHKHLPIPDIPISLIP